MKRDHSRYGRGGSRYESIQSRSGSAKKNFSSGGNRGDRKSESVKRMEKQDKDIAELKKDITEMKKSQKSMEEMMKNLIAVSTKYVEEEFVIDVKLVENYEEFMMIIDSGAPISLASLA